LQPSPPTRPTTTCASNGTANRSIPPRSSRASRSSFTAPSSTAGRSPQIDAFCVAHGLPFRRWSGGCLGAFLPEIVLFDGSGPLRDYTASEDEWVLFPPSWIRSFTRLRDLKREMARAELTIPPFLIVGCGDQS
jgi:hypothetical protein